MGNEGPTLSVELRTEISALLDMPGSFGRVAAYLKQLEATRTQLRHERAELIAALELALDAMVSADCGTVTVVPKLRAALSLARGERK